jgi:CMP-N-acetylneuraminic acid synthetase|tara:strand:+ start:947 stop:1639 length:693 start_codon:yes stop_codon:yes gene_type:complete
MYKNKRILAIVLARSGSKSIKNKNIYKIKKIPLIGYTGKVLSKISIIDLKVVSTDSNKIGNIAKKYGLSFLFKRPKQLAKDRVSDYEAIKHALLEVEKITNKKYDIILSLPPTSPLRKKINILDCLKKIISGKYDSVWSISKVDSKYNPEKQLSLKNNNLRYYHKNGPNIIARQQLKSTFFRNGAVYAMTRKCILNKKKLITNNSSYVLIKTPQVSIDTYSDIKEVIKYI